MTDRENNNKAMNSFFIGALSIFFSIYFVVNYYVGLHFFRSVQSLIEPYSLIYWVGYALLAMSLFVARLTQCQNPVMNIKLKITRFCNWLQSL